ncbi:pilus assembly protein [Massilia sp. G4R7]|uniref:Pilus assembly protein n=1 Tax=Massilia phyllostachyos TaxID=2898585 RepID=A0ABS8QBW6_9BURK|nr:pilus assembly protein [Massilia phyllostachyos]MCD2519209.1 pilus assembly protein [Massilia phyllostachyos]
MTILPFSMSRHAPHERQARQRGIALLTALLLMLAVLMTGIAAARAAIGSARISGHERDRMLALHGAMAGLLDAEHDIEGGADPGSARAMALANADPDAFAEGCRGSASYEGLCRHGGADDIHDALSDPDGPGVTLGAYSGARMPLGGGALAVQPPRYLIELMPSGPEAVLYRITALGFGSVDTTQAAVQAYYRKLRPPGPPGPGAGPPSGPDPASPDTPGAPGMPGVPSVPDAPGGPDPSAPEGAGGPAAPSGPPGPDTPPGTPDPPGPDAPPGAPGTPGGPGIRVGWREIGNWQDTMVAASVRTERR